MSLGAVTAIDVLWIALSAFLILVALGLLYLLVRLGGTVGRLTAFLKGLETELLPLLGKAGGSIDRMNAQLDKVDVVTDSAVDAAESVDTAVRAVSLAVTRPVQKISGFVAGVTQGSASLRARRSFSGAVETGRAAAARREREILEELEADEEAR